MYIALSNNIVIYTGATDGRRACAGRQTKLPRRAIRDAIGAAIDATAICGLVVQSYAGCARHRIWRGGRRVDDRLGQGNDSSVGSPAGRPRRDVAGRAGACPGTRRKQISIDDSTGTQGVEVSIGSHVAIRG